MKSKTLLTSLAIASTLFLATDFISVANAAQGCGAGYHRTYRGYCVTNFRRHYVRAHYVRTVRPHCWRNAWGHVRCR